MTRLQKRLSQLLEAVMASVGAMRTVRTSRAGQIITIPTLAHFLKDSDIEILWRGSAICDYLTITSEDSNYEEYDSSYDLKVTFGNN